MKDKRSILVAAVLLLLIGFGGFGLVIRSGHSSLPPTAAAPAPDLSGTWQGTWKEIRPTRLVVESVNLADRTATLFYAWEDYPDGPFTHGLTRVRARILPDGKLQWSYAGGYTFELSEDGSRLVGTRRLSGKMARVVMTRVSADGPLSAVSPR